ncbi:Cna B-type domain-containing protein [Fundicoccus culcitae]|uniref:Cna B-type domain-containing protein n=1 Tax=Fundicoccus culcitae TaxID=2969821 RepID=A0ABY5P4E3_9LACT|nr:Cna B-type domain-containing protein [Fundicoccus culcitae]UUX33567.1 Cna B-type domain-containing protein [Fundicoccus culcitae]
MSKTNKRNQSEKLDQPYWRQLQSRWLMLIIALFLMTQNIMGSAVNVYSEMSGSDETTSETLVDETLSVPDPEPPQEEPVLPPETTVELPPESSVEEVETLPIETPPAEEVETVPPIESEIMEESEGTPQQENAPPAVHNLKVKLVWDDAGNQDGVRPTEVKVQLQEDSVDKGEKITLSAANDWKYTWENLLVGKSYDFKKLELPAGYVVTKVEKGQYDIELTASRTPELTQVNGSVAWLDEDDAQSLRPGSLVVKLMADGAEYSTVTADTDSGWNYAFSGLARYHDGMAISYAIAVDGVEHYATSIDGFAITQTVEAKESEEPAEQSEESVEESEEVIEEPALMTTQNIGIMAVKDVSVTLNWDDLNDADGMRPASVTLQLLTDGVAVEPAVTLIDAEDWSFTWADLDSLPVYTLATLAPIPGYTVTINDIDPDNIVIELAHAHEVRTINGSITWNDPVPAGVTEVTIYLLANGSQTHTVTTSASSGWAYSFVDVPTNFLGDPIDYSVFTFVTGYTTQVSGFNLLIHKSKPSEKHVIPGVAEAEVEIIPPNEMTIDVDKVWVDFDNLFNTRPTSLNFDLTNSGGLYDSRIMTMPADSLTFGTVPYSTGINYQVTENPVPPGYTMASTFVEEPVYGDQKITITLNILVGEGIPAGSKDFRVTYFTNGVMQQYTGRNIDAYVPGDTIQLQHTIDLPFGVDPSTVTIANVSIETKNNNQTNFEFITSNNWALTGASISRQASALARNYTVTNTLITTSIEGTKTWNDANDQDGLRPSSITVKLLANGVEVDSQAVTAANGWSYTFSDLPTYRDGVLQTYTIEEVPITGYTFVVNGYNITNTHIPELIQIAGTKTWDDADNQDGKRPDSITVRLLADDVVKDTQVVTATNGWNYTFSNLPKYRDGGTLIVYTVDELPIAGYTPEITGFNIKNIYVPEVVTVEGTKTWDDANNQDGIRPTTITVQLKKDGVVEATQVVSASLGWTYTFSNLPKYRDGGTLIIYTVDEVPIPGYTPEFTGFDIKNTHIPATRDISGEKHWDDADNQDGIRPSSIMVNLLANGNVVRSVVVTEADNWAYEFTNLPVFANGIRITYDISENAIPDYTPDYDGFDIYNRYTPEETSVKVNKSWDDNSNQDGIRPTTIDVQLVRVDGGVDTNIGAPVSISLATGWSHTWTGLPLKDNGVDIVYSVRESGVPSGYTVVVNDDDHGNILINNSHTPETRTINGVKTWDDANNQDGIRPTSITVNLLANGNVVNSLVVTAADNWTYEFTNLPVFANGIAITYDIAEEAIPGYTPTYSNFNITNRYTPQETSVKVNKSWNDNQNQDGKRPTSIQVQLVRVDGGVDTNIGTPVSISLATGWSHTWTGLPLKDDGVDIVYSVREIGVPSGYTVVLNDSDHGNILLNNNYTPETRIINGVKTWDDANNQDGIRPTSITVNLLANGNIVRSVVVTEADNWTYEFTDLPVYLNGVPITYAISENAISGYTPIYSNFNITNRYTPQETSVKVNKSWNDNQNQDGIRPTTIQVQLVRVDNGVDTNIGAPVSISLATGWSHTWTGLPLKDNGVDIVYSVREIGVPSGYTVVLNDSDHGNILLNNNYTPETRTINGVKTWDDANNQDGIRPTSITVNLLANGNIVRSVVVTEADNWAYEFTNLPVFLNGVRITYEITEASIPGYTPIYSNFNITNRYTPQETSVKVNKSWNDNQNQDGIRPATIQVQLVRVDGGVDTNIGAPVSISLATGWSHAWTGLPVNDGGVPIVYSVREIGVLSGYTVVLNEQDPGNILLNNNYTPETRTINGTKSWDDANNQDGIRPASITINLLANGNIVRSVVVTEADDWKYEFTNLPVFLNGVRITYDISENAIPGYTPDYDGFDIINRYTPEVTSVKVNKSWNDNQDQDGKRPTTIQVQLVRVDNGVDTAIGAPVSISLATAWSHTWTGLPLKDNGVPIVYSVREVGVPSGYTVVLNDSDHGNILLNNNYTPETRTINGIKTWDDANNQDGIRPTSITVNLLANGNIVRSVVVTEADDWKYEFANLPVFLNGARITYEITEASIPGYTPTYSNFNITNRYTPEVTSVKVNKSWNDNQNQDGIRPATIRVQLVRVDNGIDTNIGEPVSISLATLWSHTWAGLPVNDNGVPIVYSVRELDVPTGYTVVLNDNDPGNVLINNNYIPETRTINGTKTWDDANNQDGIRPASITVNLIANGNVVRSVVVTEADDWKYEFTNLPVFANGIRITYDISENAIPGYTPDYDGFDIINRYTPEVTSVKVNKSWNDNQNQDGKRPTSIQVQLVRVDGGVDTNIGAPVSISLATGWSHTWTDLPLKDSGVDIVYSVREIGVPSGYTVVLNDQDPGNILLNNNYTPETRTIKGVKTWDDANNQDGIRPVSITVNLLANGNIVRSVVVTDADNWSYEFTNLPVFLNGVRITYDISESTVPGYTPTYSGFNITNRYTPEVTSVKVNKSWNDNQNQDGKRPTSIQVQLVRVDGGVDTNIGAPVSISLATGWSYTWTGLPLKDSGVDIVYSVREIGVPSGYTVVLNEQDPGNILLNNNYTPETRTIKGVKTWDDANNQDGIRPVSITVNLLANGNIVRSVVVTEADNWLYEFTNLPVFLNGVRITYDISESTVPGYTPTYSGFNITNRYTPEVTSVKVNKSWNDNQNQDGIRPTTIRVQLVRVDNGIDTAIGEPVSISLATLWSHEWAGLPMNDDGVPIVYSVRELDVPTGYTVVLNDRDHGNILLNNNYTPETRIINGMKVWDDANNQDGIRPESITVNLLANGNVYRTTTVTEADNWAYEFTNLPVFLNGVRITYEIVEETVPGYTPDYDGFDIYNRYTPEETSVKVNKSWNDNQNQDGKRPTSIQVQLIRIDETVETAIGTPVTISLATLWSHEWTGLPAKDSGQTIVYSVRETNVPDEYTVVINDQNHGNILLNNNYTPETRIIKGEKVWDDENNQDGIRPKSITINLLANGNLVRSVIVTEADDWKYEFTNLPVFANGARLTYDITENTVPAYTPDYDGFDIYNRYTPEETSVRVTKSWNDNRNQDGIRPESIHVQLIRIDGDLETEIGEPVIISLATLWSHAWTGLPAYDDGMLIQYSVRELDVPFGYTVVINDKDIGNILINNNYIPETRDIAGKKTWDDADNQDGIRPESITVNLLADGVVVGSQTVTAEEDWVYAFNDLPVFKDGVEITYTLTEDTVIDYIPEFDGFDITNIHSPEETSVTVNKSWIDGQNQDGIRPESILVQLKKLVVGEGLVEVGEPVELTEDMLWTYTWTGLPANGDGLEIVYVVHEVEVPEGYEVIVNHVSNGNFLLMNIHEPATIDLSGEKTWDDMDNQDGVRPESITVNLLANGEIIETLEVSEATGWAYAFADLPEFKEGVAIVYTIAEDAVEGYTPIIEGMNITNERTPHETSISVNKVWVDNNDAEGNRPESIEVQLLADGEASGDVVILNAENDWAYTWTGLALKDAGELIVYSVMEVEVPTGYESDIVENDFRNIQIINYYTPQVMTIEGQKIWKDDHNKGDTRPESITVHLKLGDEIIETQVVKPDEAGNWRYLFESVAMYDEEGKILEYTLEEETVEGYTTAYEGRNIINTLKVVPPEPKPKPEPGPELPATGDSSYVWIGLSILLLGFAVIAFDKRRYTDN